jgi:hypothetical protein
MKVSRRGALLGAIGSVAATVATRGASAKVSPEPELVRPHPYATPEPPSAILRGPLVRREYPLGFQCVIPPHTGREVVARPAILFSGHHLVMPVAVRSAFRMVGILVGRKLFRTPGLLATPIDLGDPKHLCYGGTGLSVGIEIDMATPNQSIELLVENITDKEQTFTAAMIGIGVEPD